MNEMIDPVIICLYCGEKMDWSDEKEDKWGLPDCCEFKMLKVEKNNIFKLLAGLDKVKEALEAELVKDF